MDPRNYLANASPTPPEAPAAPSTGYPQSAVPGVTEATTPGPHWFYKIGESLRRLIIGSGQTPNDAAPDSLDMVLKGVQHLAGAQVKMLAAADSPAVLTITDAGLIIIDATAGDVSLQLPAASALPAIEYQFVRVDTSANTVTINRAGTDTIDGVTSITVSRRISIKSDGASVWQRTVSDIATQAITDAGTDDETIVTPKKLRWGFSFSPGSPGYIAFPSWLGGLVIQWGHIYRNVTNSSVTVTAVTFPLAFPHQVFTVVETPSVTGSAGSGYYGACDSITQSGFNHKCTHSSASGVLANTRYIAIGY